MTTNDDIRMAGPRLAIRVVELIKRAVRGNPNLNQKEIANRLGVNESRLSQIVNGDGNIQIATLARVLAATGYEVEIRAIGANGEVLDIEPRRRRTPKAAKHERVDDAVPLRPTPVKALEESVHRSVHHRCSRLNMNAAVGAWSTQFASFNVLRPVDMTHSGDVEVLWFYGLPDQPNLEHVFKHTKGMTSATDEYAIELMDA